ncbi:MAG: hypothetical protein WCK35_30570 [Chloroflexota bacterium]
MRIPDLEKAQFVTVTGIEQLLKMQNRKIEVINQTENGKEDLVQDFVRIVTSFCARLYGQRCSKRKTDRIIAELTETSMRRVAEQ